MNVNNTPVKCPLCGNPLFFVKSSNLVKQYVTAPGNLISFDEYHKCGRCRKSISVKHNKTA